MQRTTIAIDDDLASGLDAHIRAMGATSRSEAARDLVRRGLKARPDGPAEAPCIGAVSCAIDQPTRNQSTRNLAARVPQGRLDRHDRTISVLSVPLYHSTSIDVTVMRGSLGEISAYAEARFLERGVMHGTLSLIPVAEDKVHHVRHRGAGHEHAHLRAKSGF